MMTTTYRVKIRVDLDLTGPRSRGAFTDEEIAQLAECGITREEAEGLIGGDDGERHS